MNVKLNDTVVVLTGKDAGKTGKVVSTSPKAGRVTVQGVNLQKKHQKRERPTPFPRSSSVKAPSTPPTSWSSATRAARLPA